MLNRVCGVRICVSTFVYNHMLACLRHFLSHSCPARTVVCCCSTMLLNLALVDTNILYRIMQVGTRPSNVHITCITARMHMDHPLGERCGFLVRECVLTRHLHPRVTCTHSDHVLCIYYAPPPVYAVCLYPRSGGRYWTTPLPHNHVRLCQY